MASIFSPIIAVLSVTELGPIISTFLIIIGCFLIIKSPQKNKSNQKSFNNKIDVKIDQKFMENISEINSNKTKIIFGICGTSCSGKTTLANVIVNSLKQSGLNIVIISQDWFYKGGNENTNYDEPEALDFKLMIELINSLMKGNIVDFPQYDFKTHKRATETIKIEPANIIIIEGILIFSEPKLLDLFTYKVFIETDSEVCLLRRLNRDVEERGRSIKEVAGRYLRDVKPSNDKYVNPSRKHANIMINNSEDGLFIGADFLISHILCKIK